MLQVRWDSYETWNCQSIKKWWYTSCWIPHVGWMLSSFEHVSCFIQTRILGPWVSAACPRTGPGIKPICGECRDDLSPLVAAACDWGSQIQKPQIGDWECVIARWNSLEYEFIRIYLSIYLSIYLFIYLSIYLSIHPSIYPSIYLSTENHHYTYVQLRTYMVMFCAWYMPILK